jgi:hypothetical protein
MKRIFVYLAQDQEELLLLDSTVQANRQGKSKDVYDTARVLGRQPDKSF